MSILLYALLMVWQYLKKQGGTIPMIKELTFEDGYTALGEFTAENIRNMKNLHGIIISEKVYR